MSITKINLRKLLQLMFADPKLQRALLLKDIREDKSREVSSEGGGGDFYSPFWSDAKDHVAGLSDLTETTAFRIDANKTRKYLYPVLRDCFLEMWREKMRWRNEPFQLVPKSVHAQLPVEALGTIVKIENTASVRIWDGSHRVIYPYFSKAPPLPDLAIRLAFWAMREALPSYALEEFRVIDMQRKAYFRPSDFPLDGSEQKTFIERYAALIEARQKLIDEKS